MRQFELMFSGLPNINLASWECPVVPVNSVWWTIWVKVNCNLSIFFFFLAKLIASWYDVYDVLVYHLTWQYPESMNTAPAKYEAGANLGELLQMRTLYYL